MNDWKSSMKISYLKKRDFYGHFNMEDITDTDYVHANKVFKDFEIKNFGKCHDLYAKSNKLLLDDVFENF